MTMRYRLKSLRTCQYETLLLRHLLRHDELAVPNALLISGGLSQIFSSETAPLDTGRSYRPRSVSQPSILSATACHPGSSIMLWPMFGKNSASVPYACAVVCVSASVTQASSSAPKTSSG